MAWQKGHSGNPAGRPKGAKDLVPAIIKQALLESFQEKGGAKYLAKLADERPELYVALLGKILPAEVRAEVTSDVPTLIIRNYTGRSLPELEVLEGDFEVEARVGPRSRPIADARPAAEKAPDKSPTGERRCDRWELPLQ